MDEDQMVRRIRRKVERGHRHSKALSYILFLIVLCVGVAVLYSVISHWFTTL